MLSTGFHAAQRPSIRSYDVASRTGPSTGESAPKVASLYAAENKGTKWPVLAWSVRPIGHQGASTQDRAVVWILLVLSLQRRSIGARPIGPPSNATFAVFLGGDGATTGHTLREGQKVNVPGHQAGNLGLDIGPNSA